MSDQGTNRRAVPLLLAAVVVGVVVASAHWPALSSNVISLDDTQYLTHNHLVKKPSWTSAKRFLTEVRDPSTVQGYYQPLSMISLMADYAFWGNGNDPRAFHRTSLFLHVFNSILILFLAYSLSGHVWAAAAVGLIFGAHPMTVETVPWVGERKTVLATFFALWSLLLYVRHAKGSSGWSSWLAGSLVMYVLAVMSKPTTTPLPVCMLLLDWGLLGRFGLRAVWEKTAFFAVAGVSAGITLSSQGQTAALQVTHDYSVVQLGLVTCYNVVFYFYKMVWPVGLTAIYPFPDPVSLSNPAVLAGAVGGAGIVAMAIVSLRWTRVVVMGVGFFLVALSPTLMVIGYSLGVSADKYAYLPSVGIVLMLAVGFSALWNRAKQGGRGGMIVVAIMAVGLEAVGTRAYLSKWKDTETYFKYMLTGAPRSQFLHNHLGYWLTEQGRLAEGAAHLREALEIEPGFGLAHHNMGFVLDQLGRYDEAVRHYQASLLAKPDFVDSYANLGVVFIRQGRLDAAIEQLTEALSRNPDHANGHTNLGVALLKQGKLSEARAHCEAATRIDPDNAVARTNLGAVLVEEGNIGAAIEQFSESIRLDPGGATPHANLAHALAKEGKRTEATRHFVEAIRLAPVDPEKRLLLGNHLAEGDEWVEAARQYQEAIRLAPEHVKANNNLGIALANLGKMNEAVKAFSETLRIDPQYALAHNNLGEALKKLGRLDEAIGHFAEAVKIQPDFAAARKNLEAARAKSTGVK